MIKHILSSIRGQISFVGFQPVSTSEHMAALGVFGLCQIVGFVNYLRSKISEDAFNLLLRRVVMVVGGAAAAVAAVLSLTGVCYSIV